MEVLRVFNNNVVLAKDGNSEVILTGRGLGFQAKPGQRIDERKVVKRFVPSDGRDPDHMAELLAGIPPEIIRLITEAMTKIGMAAQVERRPALVMALADHLTGAIRRINKGISVEYPLQAEVQSLYAREYDQAKKLVDVLNSYLGGILPEGEVVAFAMHLVNAGFTTGDLSRTYKITGVIQQMLAVIEQSYGVKLDQHSINVGRFITHLRYLFVRISQNKLRPAGTTVEEYLKDSFLSTTAYSFRKETAPHIFLFHETYQETVDMLPWMIEYLQEMGCTFGTLDQLDSSWYH